MECDHVSKVLEWGYDLIDGQMEEKVILWGCTKCDITSTEHFKNEQWIQVDHSNCKIEPCFGCKAKGLQWNTGDAGRDISDKKWQKRLSDYRDARANGIQPAGTTPEAVREAWRASEVLNTAYNAETMTSTRNIKKNTAEVVGIINKEKAETIASTTTTTGSE